MTRLHLRDGTIIAAAVDKAWDQLRRDDTPDDHAKMLCRFIIASARDARRDTARDILTILEGEAHV